MNQQVYHVDPPAAGYLDSLAGRYIRIPVRFDSEDNRLEMTFSGEDGGLLMRLYLDAVPVWEGLLK